MTLEQIQDQFKLCPFCYVQNEIGHLSELDKPTQKILENAHGTKELYIVFCPRCENMGIVKSGN